MRTLAPTLLLTCILAGCVPPPAPVMPPVPAAPEPPRPAPEPAGDWRDRPLTPGDWSYRQDGAGSAALFGGGAGAPLLSIRCDPAARSIHVARAGAMVPAGGQMTIQTSFGTTHWPAATDATTPPHIVAVRAAGDAALDQIAFSRGRFAVETPGLPVLVVPAWAEVARAIEDCRG